MTAAYLALPPVIDTATIGALRAELLERRGADLSVDAASVQRIGGLGLQVLLAASRQWTGDGYSLKFVNTAGPFNEMLRLTGAATLPEMAL
jgi:chemotaxis protein CheX